MKNGIATASKLVMMALLLSVMVFTSCKKDPDDPEPQPNDTTYHSAGIYILNEGSFNQNNSTLTFFNFTDSTAHNDYFFNKNGRGLGDTGSDICIYGSKVYIVVNVSSQLEVAHAATGVSIERIPLFDGNTARQPRAVAPFGKHVFVCNFDNTVAVVDTATLEVVKVIEVGLNPDGITAAYGKIWVSNSGGLSFPDYDKTVSVIDPVSLTEVTRYTVGVNPYVIRPDGHGHLYLVSRGNYFDIPSRLQVMDANSGELVKTFSEFDAVDFTIAGDSAYVYSYDWMSGSSAVVVVNTKTMQVVNQQFISDGTALQIPYGIDYDPVSNLIYIADAVSFTGSGRVYAFNKQGKRRFQFNAGVNPASFAFLNRMEINK